MAMLRRGSIYDCAAADPASLRFQGRGEVYAFALVTGESPTLVVRRNRHGGALASLTGDLFVPPGRAQRELGNSEILIQRGVPTPRVHGYALYPAPLGLCRIDVVSEYIPHSADLAALLRGQQSAEERRTTLLAVAELLTALGNARVHHPDLNIRNILLAQGRACVLDVDVALPDYGDIAAVLEANQARLLRSFQKVRRKEGLHLSADELRIAVGAA